MFMGSQRSKSKRRPRVNLAALLTALIVSLALVAAVLTALRRGRPAAESPVGPVEAELSPAPMERPAAEGTPAPRIEVVAEPDPRLLWESPTAGAPISLAWTPVGAQCYVHLRPAALAAHREGDKVLAALGPWGDAALARLEAVSRLTLSEIDSALISIIEVDGGALDVALRLKLVEPWGVDELTRRLPDGRAGSSGGMPVRVVGDRAYVLVESSGTRSAALVVCPSSLVEELVAGEGDPPPVVRDMESLITHTDVERDATIIFAPRFLQASGSKLLSGPAAPLRDGVRWLVDHEATALAVSAHWDEAFYIELRAAPALAVPPRRLAAKLGQRLGAMPAAIGELIGRASWPAYGRSVVDRLPAMLAALAQSTRASEEDRLAVLNCYLPAPAGHNLLTAAELLLALPPGEPASAAGRPAPDVPQSIEELLARRTSLSFTRDSLERALELLSDDLGAPIEVAGADLQLEGITRNQSLVLDERDRPAGEILVEILRRANPDRTAASAADPRQKLVYVVRPAAGDGLGRIIVTTRSAAQRRGEALPAAFLGAGR